MEWRHARRILVLLTSLFMTAGEVRSVAATSPTGNPGPRAQALLHYRSSHAPTGESNPAPDQFMAAQSEGRWSNQLSVCCGTVTDIVIVDQSVVISDDNGGVLRWDGSDWHSLGVGLEGSVSALAVATDGSLYAGGAFAIAGGSSAGHIAHWDGSAWQDLGAGVGSAKFSRISALAVAADGSLYVGGTFTTAGGISAKNIAHWDGNTWHSLGAGVNGDVRALAMAADGSLFAGGTFTSAGGSSANRIARWDGSAWYALGAGVSSTISNVSALAVADDGSLYVGGFFESAGGTSANSIARWDGRDWHSLSAGVEGDVYALAIADDGALWVGGYFQIPGESTIYDFARWDGSDWRSIAGGVSGHVYSIVVADDGSLYAGGQKFVVGSGASGIGRWNGSSWQTIGSGVNDTVYALAPANDGSLYAGGTFVSAGGSRTYHIASWHGNTWSALHNGLASYVRSLAIASDGLLYVGGVGGDAVSAANIWDGRRFEGMGYGDIQQVGALAVAADGSPYAGGLIRTTEESIGNRIARWDGRAWHSTGVGPVSQAGRVSALAVADDGTLYAGGAFTSVGGQSANRIARWDGSNWYAMETGVNGSVFALAQAVDGSLFVGGDFSLAGGSSANRIARWDGSNWHSLGDGVNGEVNSLAVADDGTLYAGGTFTSAGGSSANRIARWDGSNWYAMETGVNGSVFALAQAVDGSLFVGGDFSLAGGLPAANIARWIPEGASPPTATPTPPEIGTTISPCTPITRNVVWTAAKSPYLVACDLTISPSGHLTLERGTVAKLGQGNNLVVAGKLTAQGTAAKRVVITSYKDDTGGDSNRDGDGTQAGAGDWGAILVGGGRIDLQATDVRYGGGSSACGGLGMITVGKNHVGCTDVANSHMVVDAGSELAHSSREAVWASGFGNTLEVHRSTIRNTTEGVVSINARSRLKYNYWDDVTGPAGDGLLGSGSKVAVDVTDIGAVIKPWRCSPYSGQLPVLVVHGFQQKGDFSAIKGATCDLANDSLDIIHDLPDWFKEDGYDVWLAHYDTGSNGTPLLMDNAKHVETQVADVYAASGDRRLRIVGHSMGGLLSRFVSSTSPDKIEDVITLGSPHGGTHAPSAGLSKFGQELLWDGDHPGITDMAASSMVKHNESWPNSPDIDYTFIGGDHFANGDTDFDGTTTLFGGQTDEKRYDGIIGRISAVGWVYHDGEILSHPMIDGISLPGRLVRLWTDEVHMLSIDNELYYGSGTAVLNRSASAYCISAKWKRLQFPSFCRLATLVESLRGQGMSTTTLAAQSRTMSGSRSTIDSQAADHHIGGLALDTILPPPPSRLVNGRAQFDSLPLKPELIGERLGRLQGGQTATETFTIGDSEPVRLSIALPGVDLSEGELEVYLTRPDGLVIDAAYIATHQADYQYRRHPGGDLSPAAIMFTLRKPLSGTWTVHLVPGDIPPEGLSYVMASEALTRRRLTIASDGQAYKVGSTAHITATLLDGIQLIDGANIQAIVERHDGSREPIQLIGNGAGRYSSSFNVGQDPGKLWVVAVARFDAAGLIHERQTALILDVTSAFASIGGSAQFSRSDSTRDGLYETVEVTLGLDATEAKTLDVLGQLWRGDGLVATSQATVAVVNGSQIVKLRFLGDDIRSSRQDGPYTLGRVSLVDPSTSSAPMDSAQDLAISPAWSFNSFGSHAIGDCNGDNRSDAADLGASVLEIFDDDGDDAEQADLGSFVGSRKGCDSNRDRHIDAGDISCLAKTIFEGPGSCAQP